MNERFLELLREGLKGIISLNEYQEFQLYQFYELLIEWNKVMNLTAIVELEDVITKHFVDSLSLIRAENDLNDLKSIIDVGTGAGFPGIPLKIAFPDLSVTLLDSLNKRVQFLNEVITQLKLENISVYHGRAEDFAHNKEFRESYDMCVSRAVANMSTLAEYCMPFVKVGGYFISYKSGKIEDELEASKRPIKKLGGQIEDVFEFSLMDNNMDRTFVKVKKIHVTANTFPRKAGLPAKEPLV